MRDLPLSIQFISLSFFIISYKLLYTQANVGLLERPGRYHRIKFKFTKGRWAAIEPQKGLPSILFPDHPLLQKG